jgi:hypothetical protein
MENADFWEILPGQDVTWRPLLSLRLRIVGEDATATEEREEGDQEGAGGGVGERDMQELMNKRERKKKSVSFRVLPPSLPASTPGSGRSGQGGEREGAPLGYMTRRGGSGEQIEEKEESGVRPVGLSNIKNNCNGKKTHGGDYGYVTGTSFGDGGRRCAGDPGPFAWTRKVRRTGLALGVPVWHERLREKQTRSGETRGNGESRGEGKL